MTSTLNSFADLPTYKTSPTEVVISTTFADSALFKKNAELFLSRFDDKSWTRNYLLLSVLVISLHILAVIAYIHRDQSSTLKPVKHEVAIEFLKHEVIPPPVIQPPPPPPPPPKIQKLTPPPKPVAALRTAPAEENVKPTDIAIAENTEATHIAGPAIAVQGPTVTEAPPALQTPKVEEPVTEATANAAYLNNPKPDYPSIAARQSWGGTVTLRVRVLADGHAESVTVKKSSGRKVLDDAAITAVKNWTFVPSKRGSTAIDGWATVPIVFNPEQ